MKTDTINLEDEIVRENIATLEQEEIQLDKQRRLDFEAAKVEAKVAESYQAGLLSELGFDYELAEARRIRSERNDFAALPQNRIMSTDAIKAVCIKYGLRFLPTRFYRGALDAGIEPAVMWTKRLLGGKLPVVQEHECIGASVQFGANEKPQFSIAAPSAAFALQPRPQDPLLFLRLNALKWFLVHKWGDDLRTAEVRKGEINAGNWNSPFADRASQPHDIIPDWAGNTVFFTPGTTGSTQRLLIQSSALNQTGWTQRIPLA